MTKITETIQDDPRLDVVSLDDDEPRAFHDDATPVLATPAIVGGAALVTAGAAYGQAID